MNLRLPNVETLYGKGGELLLLLDYNKEKSVTLKRVTNANSGNSERYINMEDARIDNDQEARVFIHTLKTFSGYGAGNFAMRSLKLMSPTQDFLKLSPSIKGCSSDENQNLCSLKAFMREKFHLCDCVPWEYPKDSKQSKVLFETV